MSRNYYYEDGIDPNNQELHNNFANEYVGERNPAIMLDMVKHCSTYSIYFVTRFLQNRKLQLLAKKEQTQQVKEELTFINKMQGKITPIFLQKWAKDCPYRQIIFDYIKIVEFDDKTKKVINDAFIHLGSVGYLKHFMENVEFANRDYIESSIQKSDNYCLKYEYGIYFPKARKGMIASLKRQAEKPAKYGQGLMKQYAKDLQDMKNTPAEQEPRML